MNPRFQAQVLRRVVGVFDVPLIQNNLRGLFVEFMVAELLGEGWRHNGSDWAAYDLEHASGVRVEVKQSAALQTWSSPPSGKLGRSFSIRTPKVAWVGSVAIPATHRAAAIYIFAWHGEETSKADQRDAGQWQFFVVPAQSLPDQKTISLSAINKMAKSVRAGELKASVEGLLKGGSIQ